MVSHMTTSLHRIIWKFIVSLNLLITLESHPSVTYISTGLLYSWTVYIYCEARNKNSWRCKYLYKSLSGLQNKFSNFPCMCLFTTPPYSVLYCFVAQRLIFWGSKLWDTSIRNTYKCKMAIPSFCCGRDQMGEAVISQFLKLLFTLQMLRWLDHLVNVATWMFLYPWSHCDTLLNSQTN